MLTQEERNNEINHDWKEGQIAIPMESGLEKSHGRNWKANELLQNIPTDNITVLNNLIYAGKQWNR